MEQRRRLMFGFGCWLNCVVTSVRVYQCIIHDDIRVLFSTEKTRSQIINSLFGANIEAAVNWDQLLNTLCCFTQLSWPLFSFPQYELLWLCFYFFICKCTSPAFLYGTSCSPLISTVFSVKSLIFHNVKNLRGMVEGYLAFLWFYFKTAGFFFFFAHATLHL